MSVRGRVLIFKGEVVPTWDHPATFTRAEQGLADENVPEMQPGREESREV